MWRQNRHASVGRYVGLRWMETDFFGLRRDGLESLKVPEFTSEMQTKSAIYENWIIEHGQKCISSRNISTHQWVFAQLELCRFGTIERVPHKSDVIKVALPSRCRKSPTITPTQFSQPRSSCTCKLRRKSTPAAHFQCTGTARSGGASLQYCCMVDRRLAGSHRSTPFDWFHFHLFFPSSNGLLRRKFGRLVLLTDE